MRIAFASITLVLSALALAVPAWAQPAKPSHFVCHKTTERVGGLTVGTLRQAGEAGGRAPTRVRAESRRGARARAPSRRGPRIRRPYPVSCRPFRS